MIQVTLRNAEVFELFKFSHSPMDWRFFPVMVVNCVNDYYGSPSIDGSVVSKQMSPAQRVL